MKRKIPTFSVIVLSVLFLFSSLGQTSAQAKNVILLIGDGLGPAHFWAANLYSRTVLGKELGMIEIMNAGRTAYLVNDTADAIVTESAAAAGQIATGRRMTARAISMAADGKTPVETILEIAKTKKGMATGLVTTSGITDATPAAFASHVAHRSDETSVAEQEIKLGVDVLLGGRKMYFLPESVPGGRRKDGRNLMDEAKKAGYAIAEDKAGLTAAKGPKILGLFSTNNLAYEIDRKATKEPSLADMTAVALKTLAGNPRGFFAMIEGGRIDHASHRNDAAAMIQDVLAFDEAVGTAWDFAKKTPGTLVIVTADHETGGMNLIGHSKESKEYIGFDAKAVRKATKSFELLAEEWGKSPKPETIKASVKKALGIDLTDQESEFVAEDRLRKGDPYNYTYAFLHSLAFVLRPYYRVGWGSQTHTASPLFLFAAGPGADKVKGLMHNTEVFTLMKSALQLE